MVEITVVVALAADSVEAAVAALADLAAEVSVAVVLAEDGNWNDICMKLL
ncbi:Uncharacterised protein [Mycobacterium tuberculosis]|nr:Uncharacterised protein [Mycobacterium tuberculosis]